MPSRRKRLSSYTVALGIAASMPTQMAMAAPAPAAELNGRLGEEFAWAAGELVPVSDDCTSMECLLSCVQRDSSIPDATLDATPIPPLGNPEPAITAA